MKYISRLTALLLAIMMIVPTLLAAAETANGLTTDNLTLDTLDALYASVDVDPDAKEMPAGVLGATVKLSADWALFSTYTWTNVLTGETLEGDGRTLEVSYTMQAQSYKCTGNGFITGTQYASTTFVIPPAQTDNLEAYLEFLFTAEFLDASGVPDRTKVYDFVTANWDVILADGTNLCDNVVRTWMNEPAHTERDAHLLCTCVLGYVTSETCLLHPDDSHLPDCPWFNGVEIIIPAVPGSTPIYDYVGNPDGHLYTQVLNYELGFSDNEIVKLPTDGQTVLVYTGARSANRQWQVFTGEDWADIMGQTAPEIALNNAMLDSIFALTGSARLRYIDKGSSIVLASAVVNSTAAELSPAAQTLGLTVQNRAEPGELSTGSVVVQYMYMDEKSHLNNTSVRMPNTWTVPHATGLHTSVTIPNVQGYEAYIPDGGFVYEPDGQVITFEPIYEGENNTGRITGLKIDTDAVTATTVTVTIPYRRAEVGFTVNRLLEKPNITNTTLDEKTDYAPAEEVKDHNGNPVVEAGTSTEVKSVVSMPGKTEDLVGGSLEYNEEDGSWGYANDGLIAPAIDGFRRAVYKGETPIAADGKTSINVFYDRYYYLVGIDDNGGYGAKPVYAKYGATVSIPDPKRAGYTFAGWQPMTSDNTVLEVNGKPAPLVDTLADEENPYTVPAQDVYFKATWRVASSHYTVVYWREAESKYGDTDVKYEYWGSEVYGGAYNANGDLELDDSVESGAIVEWAQLYNSIPSNITQTTTADGSTLDELPFFHYNEEKTRAANVLTDEEGNELPITVAGDGTTVVNIYFDRNTYNLKFYYAASSESGNGITYRVVGGSTYYFGRNATSNQSNDVSLFAQYLTAGSNSAIGQQVGTVNALPTLNDNGSQKGYTQGNVTSGNYTLYYIAFTAKYGMDISSVWPADVFGSVERTSGGNNDDGNWKSKTAFVSAWNGEYNVKYSGNPTGNQTIKGKYDKLDVNLLWDTGLNGVSTYADMDELDVEGTVNGESSTLTSTSGTVAYLCFWENGANVNWSVPELYRYNIWLECLDQNSPTETGAVRKTFNGSTKWYYLSETYNTVDNSEVDEQTTPPLYGFTNVGKTWNDLTVGTDYDSSEYADGFDVHFYYDRNRYELIFNNEGVRVQLQDAAGNPMTETTIRYGVSLHNDAGFDISESYYPDTLPEGKYEFEGWYTSSNFAAGTKFDFTANPTMPASDLVLYAHWVPKVYTVRYFVREEDVAVYEAGVVQYPDGYDPVTAPVLMDGEEVILGYAPVEQKVPYNTQAAEVAYDDQAFNGLTDQYGLPVGWFYTEGTGEQAQEYAYDPSMPITDNRNFYIQYSMDKNMPYVVRYIEAELDADGNPTGKPAFNGSSPKFVADDVVGLAVLGSTITLKAKYGDQVTTGFFPLVNSHSITIANQPTGENDGDWIIYRLPGTDTATRVQRYIFLYMPIQPVEYTVHYITAEPLTAEEQDAIRDAYNANRGNDEPEWLETDRTVEIGGTTYYKLRPDYVRDTKNEYIVTETYKYVEGYRPNKYQEMLVLTATESENVINFIYEKDDVNAMMRIVHYVQNPNTGEYTMYMEENNPTVPRKTEQTVQFPQQLMTDGYTFVKHELTYRGADGKDTTETTEHPEYNGRSLTYTVPDASAALLELYYDPPIYPYTVEYLEVDAEGNPTGKTVAAPKTDNDSLGKVVTEAAKVIDGYTLHSAKVNGYDQSYDATKREVSMTIAAEADKTTGEHNRIVFYYVQQQVTFNYVAVQKPLPGCGTVALNNTTEFGSSKLEQKGVLDDVAVGAKVQTKNAHFEFYNWYPDAATVEGDQIKTDGTGQIKLIAAGTDVRTLNQTTIRNTLYVTIAADGTLVPVKTVPYQVYAPKTEGADENGMVTDYGYPVPADGTGTWNLYARFTYNTYTLKIVKEGLNSDESSIFSVTAVSALDPVDENNQEQTQEYWFALAGSSSSSSSSSSIAHLIGGTKFTIQEHLEWAWTYNVLQEATMEAYDPATKTMKTTTISLSKDGWFEGTLPSGTPDKNVPGSEIVTITIRNTKKANDPWMYDEGLIANHMMATGSYEEEVK